MEVELNHIYEGEGELELQLRIDHTVDRFRNSLRPNQRPTVRSQYAKAQLDWQMDSAGNEVDKPCLEPFRLPHIATIRGASCSPPEPFSPSPSPFRSRSTSSRREGTQRKPIPRPPKIEQKVERRSVSARVESAVGKGTGIRAEKVPGEFTIPKGHDRHKLQVPLPRSQEQDQAR